MSVHFITGNTGKWAVAQRIFESYGLQLIHTPLDPPEIQSQDVQDVATYAARYATQKLNAPVITSDVGYYITALHGFPGPFIKYINQTLSATDLARLMHGITDRSLIIRECLAYAEPSGFIRCFTHEQRATLAHTPAGRGSSIDQMMILEGFSQTKGATDPAAITAVWHHSFTHYHALARFLSHSPE